MVTIQNMQKIIITQSTLQAAIVKRRRSNKEPTTKRDYHCFCKRIAKDINGIDLRRLHTDGAYYTPQAPFLSTLATAC
jgi:hypothetical protein